MKVRKSYQKDKVIVCALEGDMLMVMRFDDEQQMRRLGECLKDLARTGAKEVEIIPKD